MPGRDFSDASVFMMRTSVCLAPNGNYSQNFIPSLFGTGLSLHMSPQLKVLRAITSDSRCGHRQPTSKAPEHYCRVVVMFSVVRRGCHLTVLGGRRSCFGEWFAGIGRRFLSAGMQGFWCASRCCRCDRIVWDLQSRLPSAQLRCSPEHRLFPERDPVGKTRIRHCNATSPSGSCRLSERLGHIDRGTMRKF